MGTGPMLDAWASSWASIMLRGLIEASALLVVIFAVWLVFRRRMSAHLACGLFLLVLLKLAVPIPVQIPWSVAGLWPTAVVDQVLTGEQAARPAPPLVSGPAGIDAAARVVLEEGLRASDPRWDPGGPGRPVSVSPEHRGSPTSSPVPAPPRGADQPSGLSRPTWLMLGWLLVVVVSLLVLVWRHVRMALLVSRSARLDPGSLPFDLLELSRLAGLRHPVAVVSAPWAGSPAVWGLIRPCVILPPDLVDTLGPDALRWALLHELAHIRRRDGWVALFQRLMQIAYFFHPAVWVANRMIDIQREYACDDAALAAAGVSRRVCGNGFLSIVERASASPAPRVPALGLLHSPALIRRRLMRILDARRPVHARLTAGAAGLLALTALIVLPRVQARPETPADSQPGDRPVAAAPAPAPETPPRILIRVNGAAGGGPLRGASLVVRSYRLGYETRRLTADEEGRCEVILPAETPEWLTVAVHADGYVPMSKTWQAAELSSDPSAEHAFSLARGEPLGGVIRDEQGRPIAGVEVTVWVMTAGPYPSERVDTNPFPVRTDSEGRWRAAYLPSGIQPEPEVWIRLEHPDFVSEPGGFSRQMTVATARTLEHVEVMAKGVTIEGRVIGPDGGPVRGAEVALDGLNRGDVEDDTYRATSDADGRFRIAHIQHASDRRGGHHERLMVQAPGFAPQVQRIEIGPDRPSIEIRLAAARPLRGRVVDPAGRPIARAVVAAGSYQQCRSLRWRVETDGEGRFEWPDGPDSGTVELEAYRAPYPRAIRRNFPAGSESAEIVLHRPLRARGTVVDARTGEPIERFVLSAGTGPLPPDDRYMWSRSDSRPGRNGAFDEADLFDIDQPIGKALRVEADGYLPQVFDGFTTADGLVEYDFRLQRAEPITGIVRDPEERPLPGVQVELSFSARDHDLGSLQNRPPTPKEFSATTDAEGRYTFTPREKPFGVVVVHERGFARLWPSELARSADIQLQPWSRIEGTYRVGDRPAANQEIMIVLDATSPASTDFVHYTYRTRTDAEGRFAVDRVVPGFAVAFTPTVGPYSFEVRPAETARLTLGGSGRTVVGRVTAPNATTLPYPMEKGAFARLVLDRPEPKRPEGFAAMSTAESVAYHARWYRTPEGRASKLGYQGNRIRIEADGSFRAVDVPPGTYKLEIHIRDAGTQLRYDEDRTEVSATVERTVIVPEGLADRPIDLGTLELNVTTRRYTMLGVGQPAPDFDGATTLDGKPLRLSDYRGKFVLVDFWATWCGPCLQEEPHLKAAREAFRGDDRVVMISLSLDEKVEAPAEHVRVRGLDWVQGFLGGAGADVTARFGASGIPQILLIGPDGKVIARDLRGGAIRGAIASALRKS